MGLLLSYDIVMLVSRKDKLALFLVIPAGAALTFILRHPSLSSPYILFAFQILVIPLIAYVSDTQRFLVWQVGVCGLTGSLLMGIMHAGGVTKREILPVGFVFLGNRDNSLLTCSDILVFNSSGKIQADPCVHSHRALYPRALVVGETDNPLTERGISHVGRTK